MTDAESETPETRADEEKQPTPGWLLSSLADLEGLDFEKPIAESQAAECSELSAQ